MRSFLQFIFILILRANYLCLNWNVVSWALKKSILSTETFAWICNVLAYSPQSVLVIVLAFYILTKRGELLTRPFEFVIPMSHLPFFKLKEYIEFLIWRRNEAIFRLQIAKDIIHCFRYIFGNKMFDDFNHRY